MHGCVAVLQAKAGSMGSPADRSVELMTRISKEDPQPDSDAKV